MRKMHWLAMSAALAVMALGCGKSAGTGQSATAPGDAADTDPDIRTQRGAHAACHLDHGFTADCPVGTQGIPGNVQQGNFRLVRVSHHSANKIIGRAWYIGNMVGYQPPRARFCCSEF